MALDSSITCCAKLSDEQIRQVLRIHGITSTVSEGRVVRFQVTGLRGTIVPASDLSIELAREVYGFAPTKQFLFRLDKFGSFQDGLNRLVEICILVLRDVAQDAVFMFEDHALFLRRHGTLLLKPSADDKSRETLLIKIAQGAGNPFTFGDIPAL